MCVCVFDTALGVAGKAMGDGEDNRISLEIAVMSMKG